jgi:hypothetical protein
MWRDFQKGVIAKKSVLKQTRANPSEANPSGRRRCFDRSRKGKV